MSINWNGEPTFSFNSSRGLRQGDPLSPYLFVLALERLSHFIQDRVNEGRWKPLSFGRGGGPKLYHICFADDLVLVAEANNDQVILIKDALDRFCLNSGQKINFNKSKVFFSRNIVDSDATMLSHGLGIEKTHDLGMYLGAPMLHQRISRNSYTFIIDKMRKKLSSWKSNNLSFAGRVTLAQSSLSCIAGYVMQTTNIPASICEEAEKICRDFIWGSTNQHRKCHLVSWEKICRPKEEGGLGFRNLRILNQAYIHKLAWQMVADPNKLWVQVMRAKYKCGFLSTPNITTRSNSSNVWKAIVKAWEQVKPHLRWVINDGHGTRFWKDCWIPNCGVLAEQYSDSIPMGEIEYSVSSYVIDGDWNWNMLASRVPESICNLISKLKAPTVGNSDIPNWDMSTDGNFSINSAYKFLSNNDNDITNVSPLFDQVWHWQGPNRIRAILWKLAHGSLMTNAVRAHRQMTTDDTCPRCQTHPETIMHMLRDCEDAQNYWN
jgi:mannosylglycoprotein endo-beta-mannosidase